MWHFEYDILLH